MVAIDDVGRRVLFVDNETAEAFARYLLATTSVLVILERWRDGARVGYQLLRAPQLS